MLDLLSTNFALNFDFSDVFLNEHQLLATFWDLILIEQAKGFNLRHMTVLRSLTLVNYYVITKKLREKC